MARLRMRRRLSLGIVAATLAAAGSAHGAAVVFSNNLAGFNAAAGSPPVSLDFDSVAKNSDVSGQTINGVTLNATGAALIVVQADETVTPGGFSGTVDTSTNVLPATSGANVLSPGGTTLGPGPNSPVESDGLELVFATPVNFFGFDHLSQSADGFSFTSIDVFSPADALLYSAAFPISNLGDGGAPAGADFWGIVFDAGETIGRIVITELDNDALFPDANIGYDTFRYGAFVTPPPPNGQIPTPAALPAGLALGWGLALRRRRPTARR